MSPKRNSGLKETCAAQVIEITELQRKLIVTEEQVQALSARCQVEMAALAALTEQLTSSNEDKVTLEAELGRLKIENLALSQRLKPFIEKITDEGDD